jgi:hypothetical protein
MEIPHAEQFGRLQRGVPLKRAEDMGERMWTRLIWLRIRPIDWMLGTCMNYVTSYVDRNIFSSFSTTLLHEVTCLQCCKVVELLFT